MLPEYGKEQYPYEPAILGKSSFDLNFPLPILRTTKINMMESNYRFRVTLWTAGIKTAWAAFIDLKVNGVLYEDKLETGNTTQKIHFSVSS